MGDEEGLACFWFGAEAQSSLRDFRLSGILTQHGSQLRRTVLGYFRASLRDLGMEVDGIDSSRAVVACVGWVKSGSKTAALHMG